MNREELHELARIREEKRLKKFNSLKRKVEKSGKLDEDGYPTKSALEMILIWDYMDIEGWFKFIEEMWYMKWFGWHSSVGIEDKELNRDNSSTIKHYFLSTAGWSGNESIIKAMEKNVMLWSDSWLESRRGGHYIFEIKND